MSEELGFSYELKKLAERALPMEFYRSHPVVVARNLLAKVIVRRVQAGLKYAMILETEAYADNEASYANEGQKRSGVMLWRGGLAYIVTQKDDFLFHVTTNMDGEAGAVLIRSVSLLSADELKRGELSAKNLVNGPDNVARALDIRYIINGIDLIKSRELCIIDPELKFKFEILAHPRIGVSKARDKLWRFSMSRLGEAEMGSAGTPSLTSWFKDGGSR